MLKARIADWILSLVIDPQRSAAAVGDLMEEGSERALRFWMGVGRILVSAFGDTFAINWPSIVRLTGLALLLQLAGMIAIIATILAGSSLLGYLTAPNLWAAAVPLIGYCFGFILLPLVEFQVGKLIARRSPGQELAVCVSLLAVQAVLGGVVDAAFTGRMDPVMFVRSVFSWSTPAVLVYIALFAGAARVRRRRIAG